MEFQEVTELVPGTKYRIVYEKYLHFRGFYSHTEEYPIHVFRVVHGYGFSNEKKFAHGFNKFYLPIFQRDRIQQTMEERALQLILKNIIGDSTFHW
uniref:Uncharacterized protein n=1 Tax=viral metagenome TaxID=1070528 RepID=A0A6C0HYT1_9ZZZZ